MKMIGVVLLLMLAGTAEADCGWVLLRPPVDKETASYSQWEIIRSFDQAEACEGFLVLMRKDILRANAAAKQDVAGTKTRLNWMASKCVPSTALKAR